MKKTHSILVVDDEPFFLCAVSDGLAPYASLEVHTASDGEAALETLRKVSPIDLVITDLCMPRMDGFALIADLSRRARWIPTIVVTAHASPEARARLSHVNGLDWLEKPVDIDLLVERIFSVLTEGERGYLPEMTLASFLQLLAMERKSCHLSVTAGGRTGSLGISEGRLVHAAVEHLTGEAAAYEIIGWGEVGISIDGLGRGQERNVNADLGFLIMESLRRKDEEAAPEQGREVELVFQDPAEWPRRRGPGAPSSRPGAPSSRSAQRGLLVPNLPDRHADGPAQTATIEPLTKENNMAIEKHLQPLRDIKGYRASAILNHTGETLAVDNVDPSVDLALVGATFNDILRASHEAGLRIGLEATDEVVIKTKKGLIVLHCSGVDAKVHVHFIGVMGVDGNQALLKMRVEQMLPKIVAELG